MALTPSHSLRLPRTGQHRPGLWPYLPVLILVVVSGFSYHVIARMIAAGAGARHTLEVIAELREVHAELADLEAGAREYAARAAPADLERYNAALATFGGRVSRLRALTAADRSQQGRLDELDPLLRQKLDYSRRLVELRRGGSENPALQLLRTGQAEALTDRIAAGLRALEAEEERLLEQEEAAGSQTGQLARVALAGGCLLALGLTLALGLLGSRETRRREQAEATLQANADRMAAVIATQQEIATADLDLRLLMALIAERAQSLTGAAGAAVALLEGGELVYAAATGAMGPHAGMRVNRTGSLSGLTVRTGQIQVCLDCESDERVDREAFHRVGARSAIIVPLRHLGSTAGALAVSSPQPGFFTTEHRDALSLMAGLLGGLMDRALDLARRKEAEEAVQRSRDRLAVAVAAQQEVATAELDLGAMLPLIAERAQALTRAAGATVELIEGEELVYAAGSGTAAAHVGVRARLAGSLAGHCVRTGQTQLCNDVYADPHADHNICRKMGLRSVIVAPLYHGGKAVGALMVSSGEPGFFHAEDRGALELITGILGTLMDRARDFERRRRAEDDLRKAHASLEIRVQERTAELREANSELERKREELAALSQQMWQTAKLATMGELSASIAHELNNPLGTVSLRVESLLATLPEDDRRRRALEVVEQEVERMATLVSNLLQFSRRSHQQTSSLDVREEIDQTLELMRHYLRNRRTSVECFFPPEPVLVHADRQQLRQVFLNLLTNASDAMPGGGALTVRVSIGEGVRIDIEDTGSGIPPELLAKVKEPFFTTKPEGKGTGLGLAICNRIVEEHRGTFSLASRPGEGTTASICLPGVPAPSPLRARPAAVVGVS